MIFFFKIFLKFTFKIFQVVVKPSGVMWHGSQGVTFHNKEDTEGISRTVLDLLSQIEPQDCVLVEDFHAPPTGQSIHIHIS